MPKTKYSKSLHPQDGQISLHTIGTDTNNSSSDSVKPSRRSSKTSKLARLYKSECSGMPEWVLRKSSTVPASSSSSSSIHHSSLEINELKVSLPLNQPFVKIRASDQIAAAQAMIQTLPIRIPITATSITEPVHNKIPEIIKIPAAADARPGACDGKREECHSDTVSSLVCSIPVKNLDIKPKVIHETFSEVINKFDQKPKPILPNQTTFDPPSSNGILDTIKARLRQPRKHPVTAVTLIALPERPRRRRRSIKEKLDAERQKMEDYPESAEQLAELDTLKAKIQKTEGDIKRLNLLISETVDMIKEQEKKKLGNRINICNGRLGEMAESS